MCNIYYVISNVIFKYTILLNNLVILQPLGIERKVGLIVSRFEATRGKGVTRNFLSSDKRFGNKLIVSVII